MLAGIMSAKNAMMLSVFTSGMYWVMYGISVNKKMIAGKMARIKLNATPFARLTISFSVRSRKKSLTILYNDTLSHCLNFIFLIQKMINIPGVHLKKYRLYLNFI